LVVRKRFVVKAGSYDWTMGVDIARSAGAPAVHAYTVDLGGGLALTEENEEQDRSFVAGAIREETKLHRKKLGQMKKAEDHLAWDGRIRWASVMNKYFIVGLAPAGSPPLEVLIRPSSDAQRLGFQVKVPNLSGLGSDGSGAAGGAGRGDSGAWSTSVAVYTGPQEIRSLDASPLRMGEAIDYGWAIIQPISQLLLRGLKFLYDLIPNYGVAIILISTLTKLAFYKLSHQSIKSMKDMKKIQGELEELRKRFKNDAQRLNQETMALYKKHGVNPMAGCMPMLLQTPVFIALYNVLNRTIELRGAPFVLWIDDLSAPDALAKLPFSLPFIGNNIALLPIVMGIATFLQQKMTSIDPRQMALLYIMPVFMTVIFFNFPSGLVLYWLINTVLTIAQQYYIERKERVPAGTLATSRAT
jgi:YidC/Oxa1 family membrane protein insertase